eukprot:1834791-Amphidinium_carterae.1
MVEGDIHVNLDEGASAMLHARLAHRHRVLQCLVQLGSRTMLPKPSLLEPSVGIWLGSVLSSNLGGRAVCSQSSGLERKPKAELAGKTAGVR